MRTFLKLFLLCFSLSFFISGCNICGGEFTMGGDCDGEITSDATPAPAAPETPPTPSYTLSGTSFSIAENGGSATYTVVLGSQPTAAVTVNISSADTGEITVSPSSLSFSTSNYSVAQTVTMTGVNDNISDGNQSVAITNSISSSDSNYAALDNQTVTAVNVDDDIVAITYSKASLESILKEVSSSSPPSFDNFTVVLGAQPTADVTVNFVSSDTTEATVSPSSIVFGSGNHTIAQTVTVSAVHDDEDDGDIAGVTVTGSISSSDSAYAALDNKTYTFTVQDVDTAQVVITAGYGPYVEGVAGANWSIRLSTKPTDNVTVELQANEPNQFTLPSAITFTPSNYSTSQTLTPVAINDNIIEGTHYVSLRSKSTSNDSKYNSKYTQTPDVTITDNGTGKQPNNQISGGNYFVVAVDGVSNFTLRSPGDSLFRRLYAWGDDTCGQASGLTAESYGQCDYDNDNLSKVSDYGSGQLIPRTAENSYVIDNSSIGDNSTNVPIFTGLTNIGIIASNSSNTCVLYDNRTAVQCWGRYRMSNHPHAVPNNWTRQNSFTARDLDVGYEHAAIILDNGSAVTWGYGRNGALGNGERDTYGHNGQVVLNNVKDLALGTHHSCFLFDNGTVSCAGKDERKQLGTSVDTSNSCGSGVYCSPSPLPIEGGFNTFTQIDAGNRFTMGLLDNGSIVCWGANDSGQCGMGSTSGQLTPPQISSTAPSGVLRVWAGGSRSCVATNKYKTLHCTGSALVGDGSSTNQSSFVEVDFPSTFTSNSRVVDVAMTSGGICVYAKLNGSNGFNGSQYIYDDVFCTGTVENAIGAGSQALPVRTPVKLGTPF